jgi:hypothetical protein
MRSLKTLSVALLALFLVSSCDVLDQSPKQSLASDDVLTSEKGANSTLAGAYSAYQAVIEDDYIFSELAGENAQHSGSYPSWASVDQHNLLASNAEARDLWIEYYDLINITNQLIVKVPNIDSQGFTDAEKAGVVAEAKILRALAYHSLVKFFGGVPLETEPTDEITQDSYKARATASQVYDLIEQDLKDAESTLGATGAPASRNATGYTAKALLARVNLYREDYQEAYDYADEMITDGTFSLGSYAGNFGDTPTTNEIMFRLEFTTEDFNNLAFFALPNGYGGRREYAPTNAYVGTFESGDTRINTDLGVVGGSLIWNKYNTVEGKDDVSIVRLAEMYLIRAEASIYLSGQTEDDVIADINTIRNRAGLSDISNTPAVPEYTDEELMDFIMQERSIELAVEGHRWHDLVRTGRATSTFGINANMTMWPIPQRDMDANPSLEQNPGY